MMRWKSLPDIVSWSTESRDRIFCCLSASCPLRRLAIPSTFSPLRVAKDIRHRVIVVASGDGSRSLAAI